jgi:hypothetical protein
MVLEYAHLQNCAIFGVNVGKYSSTMERLAMLAKINNS